MLSIGDIHIYVSDYHASLRFWEEGLRLRVIEREVSQHSAFARLEFPDDLDGPSLRLIGGVRPWQEGERPEAGSRPTVRFSLITDDFEDLLSRVVEYGGEQVDPVERYNGLRIVTVADPEGNTIELVEVPSE